MSTILSPDRDKLQQASVDAHTLMINNFCTQIIALQNHIANREEDNQFPSLHEANLQFKLISCMEKLKKYPSDAMSMQAINMFIHFMEDENPNIGYYIAEKFKEFMARKGNRNATSLGLEYDLNPSARKPQKPAQPYTSPTTQEPTPAVTAQSTSTDKQVDPSTIKTPSIKKPKQKKVPYSNKYTYGKTG